MGTEPVSQDTGEEEQRKEPRWQVSWASLSTASWSGFTEMRWWNIQDFVHYICVNTRNTDTRAKSGSILHLQLINTKYPLITMQQQLKHAAEPLSLNIGSFYKQTNIAC